MSLEQWPQLDDQPGPALPASRQVHQALVAGALGQLSGSLTKRPRRRWLAAAVALLFIPGVATFASAAWRAFVPDQQEKPEPGDMSLSQGVSKPLTPRIQPGSAVGPDEDPRSDVVPRIDRPRTDGPEDAMAPALSPSQAPSSRLRDVPDSRPARLTPEVARSSEGARSQAPSTAVPQQADDELKQANRLRQERAWGPAYAMYMRVAEQNQASGTGHVALLAAADLKLRQLGDPGGALQLFKRAQAHGASTQALLGQARCYRALNQPAEEREALHRVLKGNPPETVADSVRQRLSEL